MLPAGVTQDFKLSSVPAVRGTYFIETVYEILVLAEDGAADDHFLNLVGTLVNLGNLGITHHPLHMVLLHETVSAKHSDSLSGHFHGHIGAVEL